MNIFFDHYSEIPQELWRWKNFYPHEIACRGTGSIIINFDALDRLQLARDKAGRPIYINSAYRSPYHNAFVGGSIRSYHLRGVAFDPSLVGFEKKELYEILKAVGFTGFGLNYRSFLHADRGPRRVF